MLWGTHNNQPYWFANIDWFLWWNPATNKWTASELLGVVGARGFASATPYILGNYPAYGTAAGTFEVTTYEV